MSRFAAVSPRLLLGAAPLAFTMLLSNEVRAGSLPLPSQNNLDFNGPALAVTNTHNLGSASDPLPSALKGTATGTSGIGVLAVATGTNGSAVRGLYNGAVAGASGSAGTFVLTGKNASASSAALLATADGGATDKKGNYGSAAIFQTTNFHNTSPTVAVSSNSVSTYALTVVSSGFSQTSAPTGAGYFEVNSPKAQFGQSAVQAVHSGGSKAAGSNGRYGTAGLFQITNSNNFDSALVGRTASTQGTGIEGDDFSSGGGVAVFGTSGAGLSAMFSGGAGGSGTCSYDGSAGFNCPSDRNLKDHFREADLGDVLDRLGRLPMFYYQMKQSQLPTRYLGPTAQDFKAAFGLGKNDTTINTANAQGVALAAARGLYERAKADEAKIAQQNDRIADLESQVADLQRAKAQTASLEQQVGRQTAMLGDLVEQVASLARKNHIRQASATP